MKKFIALLLSVLMILTVAGCTGSASVDDATNTKPVADDAVVNSDVSEKVINIMPLGDSLTAGYPDTCGYRNYLCDILLDEGYNFMFVGPNKTDADRLERYNFPVEYSNHSAQGGWTLSAVLSNKEKLFAEKFNPDIVLLMITTNDLPGHLDIQLEERYRELVAYIFRCYPDVTLYCGNPIPKRDKAGNITEVNDRIVNWEIPFLKDLAADKQENGYDMRYVDMTNKTLNYVAEDIREDDLIHPTDSGNQKLATAWYNAIKSRLDELK